MPIAQTSQFDMKLAGPIEVKMQVQSLNDRNSIRTDERWRGMQVHVVEENTTFILIGGIDNTYWRTLVGDSDSNNVLSKTTLEVTTDLTVNWDGTVPSGGQTFREKHGENFTFSAFRTASGVELAYSPTVAVTRDGTGKITQVEFADVFPGRIVII